MKIKICGMKYPENIQDISNLFPDYLGFIFYPSSKRFVLGDNHVAFSEYMLKETIRALKVGVFVNEPLKNVIHLATTYDMNLLQLHGDESPEYCEQLRYLGFPIIKAFGIHEQFDFSALDEYTDVCDYFLFDTKAKEYGGTGKHFDWNLLTQYKLSKPIFLSGGLELDDLATIHDLIKDIPIHALDFNSKLENDFGLKNTAKCKAIIEAVHATFLNN